MDSEAAADVSSSFTSFDLSMLRNMKMTLKTSRLIRPQLPPKSSESPEVDLILQDDSPARDEPQEEEMEVDVVGESCTVKETNRRHVCSFCQN